MSVHPSAPRTSNPYTTAVPQTPEAADGPSPSGVDLGSATLSDDATLQAVAAGTQTLGVGARGPAVAKMQQALGDVGWDVGSDGAFGPKTQQGLQGFQRSAGLPTHGKLDAKTLGALDAALQAAAVDDPYADLPQTGDRIVQSKTPVASPASQDEALAQALAARAGRRDSVYGPEGASGMDKGAISP